MPGHSHNVPVCDCGFVFYKPVQLLNDLALQLLRFGDACIVASLIKKWFHDFYQHSCCCSEWLYKTHHDGLLQEADTASFQMLDFEVKKWKALLLYLPHVGVSPSLPLSTSLTPSLPHYKFVRAGEVAGADALLETVAKNVIDPFYT